jgi:hypothetical protein
LDGILWRAREGWRDLGLFEAVFAALAGSGAGEERLQSRHQQRGQRRLGEVHPPLLLARERVARVNMAIGLRLAGSRS